MGLSDVDLSLIQKSNNEQKKFYKEVEGSKFFTDRERSALKISSFSALERSWEEAANAKQEYDVDHSHGRMKLARRSQDLAATAFDIFQEMAPMFDLIADMSAPYGGLAIGIVSFFLTVANARRDFETRVEATMIAIRDTVPRLQIYQQIYNDRHRIDRELQTKIVLSYDILMRFCMAATGFYRSSGISRFMRTMKRSDQLVVLSSEFQNALVNVRHLAEVLLSKNVDIIKQKVLDLERQNRQLQESLNGNRLNLIQRLFRLETYSDDAHKQSLKQYHSDLANHPDLTVEALEQMDASRLTALLKHQDFRIWQTAESRMLLLVGYNHESILYSSQCWASPVAMHFAHQLRSLDSTNIHAVYVAGLPGQRDESLSRILFTVLLQLLRQRRSALQNEDDYAELQAKLREFEGMEETSDQLVDVLRSIALRILDAFEPSETVWVILDRVEKSGCNRSRLVRRRLLQVMVHLVERSKTRLRVLAVVNGHDWQVDRHKDELEITNHDRVIICPTSQQDGR